MLGVEPHHQDEDVSVTFGRVSVYSKTGTVLEVAKRGGVWEPVITWDLSDLGVTTAVASQSGRAWGRNPNAPLHLAAQGILWGVALADVLNAGDVSPEMVQERAWQWFDPTRRCPSYGDNGSCWLPDLSVHLAFARAACSYWSSQATGTGGAAATPAERRLEELTRQVIGVVDGESAGEWASLVKALHLTLSAGKFGVGEMWSKFVEDIPNAVVQNRSPEDPVLAALNDGDWAVSVGRVYDRFREIPSLMTDARRRFEAAPSGERRMALHTPSARWPTGSPFDVDVALHEPRFSSAYPANWFGFVLLCKAHDTEGVAALSAALTSEELHRVWGNDRELLWNIAWGVGDPNPTTQEAAVRALAAVWKAGQRKDAPNDLKSLLRWSGAEMVARSKEDKGEAERKLRKVQTAMWEHTRDKRMARTLRNTLSSKRGDGPIRRYWSWRDDLRLMRAASSRAAE